MTRNQRISFALKEAGIGQGELGSELGITQAAVSKRLTGEEIDSVQFLLAVRDLTGFNLSWIVTGDGKEKGADPIAEQFERDFAGKIPEHASIPDSVTEVIQRHSTFKDLLVHEPSDAFLSGKDIRPVAVTLSPAGEELVSYVPVKAQAGYMRGYGDPQYVETLPAFSLPALVNNGTYRMFQVDGPSMQQLGGKGLKDGDIVIAQYVEDIFDLRDNRVYVVVSTEGIAIKRVINRLRDKESPCLVMMSDNKNGEHPNYLLKPKQIREVWEAKKFISSDFSFDTDMYQILAELQVEQARLKEEMKNLSKK